MGSPDEDKAGGWNDAVVESHVQYRRTRGETQFPYRGRLNRMRWPILSWRTSRTLHRLGAIHNCQAARCAILHHGRFRSAIRCRILMESAQTIFSPMPGRFSGPAARTSSLSFVGLNCRLSPPLHAGCDPRSRGCRRQRAEKIPDLFSRGLINKLATFVELIPYPWYSHLRVHNVHVTG